MALKLQQYLAGITKKQAVDFEKAYGRIPEDKRSWQPEGKGRSANDQLAEIALVNSNTAFTLTHKKLPDDFNYELFLQKKTALAADERTALEQFHSSVAVIVETIEGISDEDLEVLIQLPWGPMTVAELMSYPDYNMSYHEGQINYIASLLGCL